MKRLTEMRSGKAAALVSVLSALVWAEAAHAYRFETGPDWAVNLDNSLQYTVGWRAQGMDSKLGNHLFYGQGNYKFEDKGDVVTNRIQNLMEFQAVYKGQYGFRTSASAWKDFAYDDDAEVNPNHPGYAAANAYPSGKYSSHTKKYHIQGVELLDAFVFGSTEISGKPVYAKLGRFTQYWGNAFFFGFSNIGYSQHPMDYIKGFSQPGSEVKELFLPRAQVLLTTELTPELSVSAQYFFEYRANRLPEGGTYLGAFDILWDGNPGGGFTGLARNEGLKEPDHNNGNFGIKVGWSPSWAQGDLGFYYRRLDEVDPWAAMVNPDTGNLYSPFADKVDLYGISYERSFGLLSTGFELSHRRGTALNTAGLAMAYEGARGNITNLIVNGMVQLNKNALWDSGVLLAELAYTRLNSLTSNGHLYNGEGTANCVNPVSGGKGSWKDGCSTDDSVAVAFQMIPQWLQAFPGVDLELPINYQYGIKGNPAYRASGFFAQGSTIASIGLRAIYKSKTAVTLQYNHLNWRTGPSEINHLGQEQYAGFGGNGPVALSDKDWIMLQVKTSF